MLPSLSKLGALESENSQIMLLFSAQSASKTQRPSVNGLLLSPSATLPSSQQFCYIEARLKVSNTCPLCQAFIHQPYIFLLQDDIVGERNADSGIRGP